MTIGGIPLLDQMLRPDLYQNGNTPTSINAQSVTNLQNAGVAPSTFNGTYADTANSPAKQVSGLSPTPVSGGQPPVTNDNGGQTTGEIQPTPVPSDLGIVATPSVMKSL